MSDVVTALLFQDCQASTEEIAGHDTVHVGEGQVRNALKEWEEHGGVEYERDGRRGYWLIPNPEKVMVEWDGPFLSNYRTGEEIKEQQREFFSLYKEQ